MEFRYVSGESTGLAAGKIVCVGRNYVAHIEEMGSETPAEPLLFMKPSTALVDLAAPLRLPVGRGSVHHELEIAVLIGRPLGGATAVAVQEAIVGYALALDLTLREVQAELKRQGLPWERAKAFDGSCPLGPFVPAEEVADIQAAHFTLRVNGALRQDGRAERMIYPVAALVAHISEQFTLLPGDVVLTGTPDGVGPLTAGDRLEMTFLGRYAWETYAISEQ